MGILYNTFKLRLKYDIINYQVKVLAQALFIKDPVFGWSERGAFLYYPCGPMVNIFLM